MKTIETIFAYIIGICEFCAYWYIRIFPPVALGGVALLIIAAVNAIEQSLPFTASDGVFLLVVGIIYVLTIQLWAILFLIQKLENRRPPRHLRKDTER